VPRSDPRLPTRRSLLGFAAALTLAAGPSRGAGLPGQGPATILVIGDSLAAQIGYALEAAVADDPAVAVLNRGRASTGLVRDDFYDWPAALDRLLARHDVDVAVVSIGMNDRQGMTAEGTVHRRFGDSWTRLYGRRVDSVMRRLNGAGIPTYWVGLPAAASRSFSEGMRRINAIFEARAFANRVTFVPTWGLTTDEAGNYTPYGRDARGRAGLMREQDGFHFTRFGSRVLAAHLLEAMDRDLRALAGRDG
jgi:hypothetical protein